MSQKSNSHSITLSVMMFLQYAVRGIWLPFLAKYLVSPTIDGGLGFSGKDVGWIMGLAGAFGAIIAPFAGQIADRYLSAEKTLAALLIISGIINFILAFATSFWLFLFLSILFSVTYMPTLSLANSVAFANLKDTDRQYPMVRAMGTLGWIIVSVLFAWCWLRTGDMITDTQRIADALKASGIIAVIYGIWAWIKLPHCPPTGAKSIAVIKALKMMAAPTMLLFLFAALIISMIHNAYYFRLTPYLVDAIGIPLKWTGAVMAVGYGAEILSLWLLGKYVNKLGYRRVLLIGATSYIIRFAIFGITGNIGWVVFAMSLHGINFAFFFAASFMFVERVASADIRHSAQTVFGVIFLGVGPILAGFYNGWFDRYKIDGIQSYHQFWLTGAALACIVFAALALFYWPKLKPNHDKITPDDLEQADEVM